ncbi:MAG: DUF998 domain-containing protein [Flavobacteriaceae bacterium]|nr:DUF998 domain-containing protein [Flavobacteriaceae bacterium]
MRLIGTLYAAVYTLMVLTAFILPSFSSEGYSTIHNSLSELGAQSTPGNWIMNSVFIMLSIVTILLGTKVLRRFWIPLYLLFFFAISLGLTAIYKHAPISGMRFLEGEHITHSIFSMITGVAFSAYCIAIVFTISKSIDKALAFFMCCLAIGLSLLMVSFPQYQGVFQRILFITAFGWLFYSLVTFKPENALKRGGGKTYFQP